MIYAISNYRWSGKPEALFEADEKGYKIKVSNSAFFILIVPLIGYFITPKDIIFSVQCSYKKQFLDLSSTKIKFFTGAKAEEQVFQNGLAKFQVSNQYSGDKIRFQIDTTSGFTIINPDSTYEIENNKTFELPLKKLLKFRMITGRITDENKPSVGLDNVEVSFNNTVHYSDDDGNFAFTINENDIAEKLI